MRACARYIAGSSVKRVGSSAGRAGPKVYREPTLDWITSDGGAYFGTLLTGIEHIESLYFKVVVV